MPDKSKAGIREKAWEKYGIKEFDGENVRKDLTYSTFEKIIAKQDNRCAICGISGDWQSLAADHCHACNIVRGGLCWRCNRRVVPAVERHGKYRSAKQTKIVRNYIVSPPYFQLVGMEHSCKYMIGLKEGGGGGRKSKGGS